MESYEKLIAGLRYCAENHEALCFNPGCPMNDLFPMHCVEASKIAAADAIEKLSMPIAVICKDGCTFCHEDFGDEYTPPSFECVKMEELEKLNIEANWCEHDLSIPEGTPVCPFFLDADMISNLFWQYHYGEKLVRDDAFFEMEERTHAVEV